MTKEQRDALFVEFVATQSAQLVHFAWLLCGDRGLAEDLVQTALEKSYRRWDRIELDNPFAYVRRAVANGYLSRQRRRLWREQPTADITGQVESWSLVGDHAEEIARRQAVLAALRRLSVRERTILVLRFHTDLTEQATADVLGISIGTVKSTTSRARQRQRRPGRAGQDHALHADPDTGMVLMAADTPNSMELTPGTNYSVSLSGDDDTVLRGYWDKLSDGGTVTMLLERAPGGDAFGMCINRFGVNWMVNIAGAES